MGRNHRWHWLLQSNLKEDAACWNELVGALHTNGIGLMARRPRRAYFESACIRLYVRYEQFDEAYDLLWSIRRKQQAEAHRAAWYWRD